MREPMAMTDFGRTLRRNEGNCWLWGCATVTLVIVLGSIVGAFTVKYYIGQLREQYTDDAPVELPVVDMGPEELKALIERTDAFSQSMEDDLPSAPLTLTQDEINALIQNHSDLEKFNGRVYIEIEDDELTGQVSAPLDIIPGFGGRYFNGSATFDVSIRNGRLSVFVESAVLKGESVPDEVMREFRKQDLAESLSNDSNFDELVSKIDSLVIEDGVVTITPANLKEDTAADAAP